MDIGCSGIIAYYLMKGEYPPVPPIPIDYSTMYLTFEALEAGTFSLNISAGVGAGSITSVSYSTDGGSTWVTTQNDSTDITITTPNIQAGGKVLWKGTASRYGTSNAQSKFSSTGGFAIYGNIMSLLYGDSFADKKSLPESHIFNNLFAGCTMLTAASNLILPAETLTSYCYNSMFQGCSALAEAPELPATVLASRCYQYMFMDCTSLTTSPVLYVETLAAYCYRYMFNGCSKLNHVTCLATDISASNCTTSWLSSVAKTGTFVKNPNMSGWANGGSGIPSGWVVEDESL